MIMLFILTIHSAVHEMYDILLLAVLLLCTTENTTKKGLSNCHKCLNKLRCKIVVVVIVMFWNVDVLDVLTVKL